MKLCAILSLFVFSFLSAGADQTQTGFKYGERPKNSIFDPAGTLTMKEQAELAEPLAAVLAGEGIDVMVVILPEIGGAPPEHVAKGFAEKWAVTDVNAVVLHVPGQAGTPWIFPGLVMGAIIKPETLGESIDAAEKRAAAEATDFSKVRAASIEACDALRYWLGGAVIISEANIDRRLAAQLSFDRRHRLLRLAAALAAASLIPLIFCVVFVVLRIRNNRPKLFPVTRIVQRLGAPYSGGNSAVYKST